METLEMLNNLEKDLLNVQKEHADTNNSIISLVKKLFENGSITEEEVDLLANRRIRV